MARTFLLAGDSVVICGRDHDRLEAALGQLRIEVPGGELYGMACDVSAPGEAAAFVSYAVSKLGVIDRWINNAGTAGRLKRPLWGLDAGRHRRNLPDKSLRYHDALRRDCTGDAPSAVRRAWAFVPHLQYGVFGFGCTFFSDGGVSPCFETGRGPDDRLPRRRTQKGRGRRHRGCMD